MIGKNPEGHLRVKEHKLIKHKDKTLDRETLMFNRKLLRQNDCQTEFSTMKHTDGEGKFQKLKLTTIQTNLWWGQICTSILCYLDPNLFCPKWKNLTFTVTSGTFPKS